MGQAKFNPLSPKGSSLSNPKTAFSEPIRRLPSGDNSSATTVVILHTDEGFIPHRVVVPVGEPWELVVANVSLRFRQVTVIWDPLWQKPQALGFGQWVKISVKEPIELPVSYLFSPESRTMVQMVVPDFKNHPASDSAP